MRTIAFVLILTMGAVQPGAAQTAAPVSPPNTADLDATRQRFDKDAATRVEKDKARDARIGKSMGSICAGCGIGAKPERSAVSGQVR